MLFEIPVGTGKAAETGVPVGRSKTFRHYDPTRSFLLAPSLDDWLQADHTARFIADVVDEMVVLSSNYASYVEASGAPPYDPTMMLKLLLDAYSTGVTSSREMERRCQVDVAFRPPRASIPGAPSPSLNGIEAKDTRRLVEAHSQ